MLGCSKVYHRPYHPMPKVLKLSVPWSRVSNYLGRVKYRPNFFQKKMLNPILECILDNLFIFLIFWQLGPNHLVM